MAQITAYNKIINGTRGDATKLNFNFTTIEEKYNEHDTATSNIHDLGTETIAGQVGLQTLIDRFNPVSTVIHIWRPSGVSCDSIDDDVYLLLNGGTVDDEDSFYHEKVLPNMDSKYLIGVETSGTIDATAIGNVNNVIDTRHTHTAPTHNHTSSSHNHDCENHLHGLTGHFDFVIQEGVNPDYGGSYTACLIQMDFSGVVGLTSPRSSSGYYSNIKTTGIDTGAEDTPQVVGNTDYTSGPSSSTSPTKGASSNDDTSSTGSATQDIQPKSLQVQMYIRYK